MTRKHVDNLSDISAFDQRVYLYRQTAQVQCTVYSCSILYDAFFVLYGFVSDLVGKVGFIMAHIKISLTLCKMEIQRREAGSNGKPCSNVSLFPKWSGRRISV